MVTLTAHPSEHELQRYARGLLSGPELLDVDDHVTACDGCRHHVTNVTGMARLAAAASAAVRRDLSAVPPPHGLARLLPENGRSVWFAAAAAVVLATIAGGNIVWGSRTSSTPATGPAATDAHARPGVPAPASPAPARAAVSLTAAEQKVVDEAVATGRMPVPLTLRRMAAPHTLMGTSARAESLRPVAPVAVAVATPTPVFAWDGVEGATAYRVELFDEHFNRVAASAWTTQRTWTCDRALEAGGTFAWQVTARTPDGPVVAPAPPAPLARFVVMNAEERTRLAELRRRAGDSHVALAVLLARAGVLDDAQAELDAAVAASPSSNAVRALRASLQAQRAVVR